MANEIKEIEKFGEGWFICPYCGQKQVSVNRWETAYLFSKAIKHRQVGSL